MTRARGNGSERRRTHRLGMSVAGGRVLLTGVRKSGFVGLRLAASLCSTGTPAHFIHAAEWAHGELGAANSGDVCGVLSHSGNTAECVAACELLQQRGVPIVALVGSPSCKLLQLAGSSVVYAMGADADEPFGGAPTCSVVAQEMACNALVRGLAAARAFAPEDFLRNHPGGSLGKQDHPGQHLGYH